ncbi:unnamed protein product [Amoebophrya sp. A25]|nr:unnamed protein product [Amoebophrya sp. A25]|eukprot:GSA25T00006376001.1
MMKPNTKLVFCDDPRQDEQGNSNRVPQAEEPRGVRVPKSAGPSPVSPEFVRAAWSRVRASSGLITPGASIARGAAPVRPASTDGLGSANLQRQKNDNLSSAAHNLATNKNTSSSGNSRASSRKDNLGVPHGVPPVPPQQETSSPQHGAPQPLPLQQQRQSRRDVPRVPPQQERQAHASVPLPPQDVQRQQSHGGVPLPPQQERQSRAAAQQSGTIRTDAVNGIRNLGLFDANGREVFEDERTGELFALTKPGEHKGGESGRRRVPVVPAPAPEGSRSRSSSTEASSAPATGLVILFKSTGQRISYVQETVRPSSRPTSPSLDDFQRRYTSFGSKTPSPLSLLQKNLGRGVNKRAESNLAPLGGVQQRPGSAMEQKVQQQSSANRSSAFSSSVTRTSGQTTGNIADPSPKRRKTPFGAVDMPHPSVGAEEHSVSPDGKKGKENNSSGKGSGSLAKGSASASSSGLNAELLHHDRAAVNDTSEETRTSEMNRSTSNKGSSSGKAKGRDEDTESTSFGGGNKGKGGGGGDAAAAASSKGMGAGTSGGVGAAASSKGMGAGTSVGVGAASSDEAGAADPAMEEDGFADYGHLTGVDDHDYTLGDDEDDYDFDMTGNVGTSTTGKNKGKGSSSSSSSWENKGSGKKNKSSKEGSSSSLPGHDKNSHYKGLGPLRSDNNNSHTLNSSFLSSSSGLSNARPRFGWDVDAASAQRLASRESTKTPAQLRHANFSTSATSGERRGDRARVRPLDHSRRGARILPQAGEAQTTTLMDDSLMGGYYDPPGTPSGDFSFLGGGASPERPVLHDDPLREIDASSPQRPLRGDASLLGGSAAPSPDTNVLHRVRGRAKGKRRQRSESELVKARSRGIPRKLWGARQEHAQPALVYLPDTGKASPGVEQRQQLHGDFFHTDEDPFGDRGQGGDGHEQSDRSRSFTTTPGRTTLPLMDRSRTPNRPGSSSSSSAAGATSSTSTTTTTTGKHIIDKRNTSGTNASAATSTAMNQATMLKSASSTTPSAMNAKSASGAKPKAANKASSSKKSSSTKSNPFASPPPSHQKQSSSSAAGAIIVFFFWHQYCNCSCIRRCRPN